MRILIFVILFFLTSKFYSQRDSSSIKVGDSKCGPAGIVLDENGKEITNAIFITGTVYESDEGREPIEYGTVWIRGTKLGTTTNKKGRYGLNVTQVNDTARTFTLVANYIGHQSKEVIIKGKLKTSQTLDFDLISVPSCEYPDFPMRKRKLSKQNKQGKKSKRK